MNLKTLYILYFALVISVIFAIVATLLSKESFESFTDGFNSGYPYDSAEGKENLPGEKSSGYKIWYGTTFPNNVKESANSEIIYGEPASGEPQVKMTVKQMKASIINTDALPPEFRYFNIAMITGSLVVTVLVVYLFVLLYKLFRRMKKSLKAGMVFSMGVVKVLRRLGAVLIVLSFFSSLCYYFHNKAVQIAIEPYGYKVDYFIEVDYILIIFGIALLLVAEFLKIGYKIQEEQSLTV